MVNPKLIIVDEPMVGRSQNFVGLVFDKLVEINKAGTSVLLVEQNARYALDICHRAYVFEIGKIALSGTRADLVNEERIRKAYLR
jgi:branched-chain amino acid transport system ATP-binding protein